MIEIGQYRHSLRSAIARTCFLMRSTIAKHVNCLIACALGTVQKRAGYIPERFGPQEFPLFLPNVFNRAFALSSSVVEDQLSLDYVGACANTFHNNLCSIS